MPAAWRLTPMLKDGRVYYRLAFSRRLKNANASTRCPQSKRYLKGRLARYDLCTAVLPVLIVKSGEDGGEEGGC